MDALLFEDGARRQAIETLVGDPSMRADIVFSNGDFVQWPGRFRKEAIRWVAPGAAESSAQDPGGR